jgi:two-component system OmpR family sensor kinase
MSLRLRLTLLYTLMIVGGLLIFGSLAYGLVNFTLFDQIDNTLQQATTQLASHLRVNSMGQFDTSGLAEVTPLGNLLFQVWDTNGNLVYARPSDLRAPLNGSGKVVSSASFGTFQTSVGSLRVYTIPLETSRTTVGILQVGESLTLVEAAQQRLVSALAILAVIIIPISGIAAWFVTRRALQPLTNMTEVATQITRADDLRRRIPLEGTAEDEIGQLIQAFNQTLERLENLFNSQNRFLADVSHELRTPLTVIKGNVGLMKQIGCNDEESLDNINQEVDRLSRLVGDLLVLAQAETGNLPLDIQIVELDTVLLEVYEQMRTLAAGKTKVNLAEIDQIRVKGDRDRLKQLFLNLVANAVQHTPGGIVVLKLNKQGGKAVFTVSDNGPGIPEEDLPHIFERFYRGEKSRTRDKTSGFGLGLSISRWIVNLHEGTINVESEVGKGTTFTVQLPLWEEPGEYEQVD